MTTTLQNYSSNQVARKMLGVYGTPVPAEISADGQIKTAVKYDENRRIYTGMCGPVTPSDLDFWFRSDFDTFPRRQVLALALDATKCVAIRSVAELPSPRNAARVLETVAIRNPDGSVTSFFKNYDRFREVRALEPLAGEYRFLEDGELLVLPPSEGYAWVRSPFDVTHLPTIPYTTKD